MIDDGRRRTDGRTGRSKTVLLVLFSMLLAVDFSLCAVSTNVVTLSVEGHAHPPEMAYFTYIGFFYLNNKLQGL